MCMYHTNFCFIQFSNISLQADTHWWSCYSLFTHTWVYMHKILSSVISCCVYTNYNTWHDISMHNAGNKITFFFLHLSGFKSSRKVSHTSDDIFQNGQPIYHKISQHFKKIKCLTHLSYTLTFSLIPDHTTMEGTYIIQKSTLVFSSFYGHLQMCHT